MVALGFKDDDKPSTELEGVSLQALSELTGFPVDYIKRELVLSDDQELSVTDLRNKVMNYLETSF
jgi:hypothetical protein